MTSSPIRSVVFLMTAVFAMPAALHAQAATPAPMSARQVINPPGIAPLVPAGCQRILSNGSGRVERTN